MYTTKRSDAAIELINEFKTHDLTRKSSNDVVKPSKFKITPALKEEKIELEKIAPIPAARNSKPNVSKKHFFSKFSEL